MQGETTAMRALLATTGLAALWAASGPAAAYTVFVSNERGNSITAIDGETLEVIEEVPVGQRPRGINMSPDGKWLYILASDDNHVQVMDTGTRKIVHTLPSGPDPELGVLHPSGNPLYVANEDDNLVTAIDVEARNILAEIPVGIEPEGMGVSPDGKVVVNTSETTNMAHFINTETYEIFANVLVDQRPRFAEFTRDGSLLYVSAEIGGTVSVIDPAKAEIVHRIEFEVPGVPKEALQPVGVRVTADGSKVYVALGPANRVALVNGKTWEVEKYFLVGQRVWQLAFSPDEKFLYTTNGVSNDISVIDVEDQTVIKSITVGAFPWGVAVKD